jgi:arylsulfatase A-like enzyme
MPDQLRPDWIGPGNFGSARTPNIDRLMARGVSFRNAVCPSPICGPSRACLATGFEYDRCTVPNNHYSVGLDEPNMYRQLARAGYQVLTCGKLDLLKGELDWGRDGQHMVEGRSRLKELGFTGGLDSGGKHAVIMAHDAGRDEPYLCFLRDRGLAETHIADFRTRRNPGLGLQALGHPGAGENFRNVAPSPLPDDAYQDSWIGRCGLDLIERAGQNDAPWFLQVNLSGPHEPMNVTQSMARSVADRKPPPPLGTRGDIPAEGHAAIRRNYTAMAEQIDGIFGDYMALLERTGQLENTVVVFTSDHGEMLGDCGLWEKFVPHQSSIGVPLVVAGPEVARGRDVERPATLLDLHATFLDIAEAPRIAGVDSRSMKALLSDPDTPHRDVVFSGLGDWRVAFDGRFKLVAGYDPGRPRPEMEQGRFDLQMTGLVRLVDTRVRNCEAADLSHLYPEVAERLRVSLFRNASACRQAAA